MIDNTKIGEDMSSINKRGTGVTLAVVILAALSADAAMIGVSAVTLWLTDSVWLRWLIATPVIALGVYFIFGWTQIRAWAEGRGRDILETDRRAQWGIKRLGTGGWIAFAVASFVTGPIGVGWYYGKRRDPRAYRLAFWSSWILAVPWAAFYVGLVSAIYHFV